MRLGICQDDTATDPLVLLPAATNNYPTRYSCEPRGTVVLSETYPNSRTARRQLKSDYTKLTSFNEAKKDCEKALELDPKYVKAYSRMGAIQCFMKEFHKARESYEKGLALDPNHQECIDGLRTVMYKIQNGETDEERARHGMADPEIQAILRDPLVS
ncbi:hypothetical protein PF005_g9830 [Phytophthora fragariae]|uniref:Uncharacterized protein n=1 Tax=Phytophthora fragariae TaxID=53985 RepID=A0A6A3EZR3_9STRA|nr:hypothetical protein PF009_g11092 [Phytophthora fragariae]KAE8968046.1 hypothetical protein PF011_g27327 [Phytophthora fragariae]KAE9115393.1 hypothetical protein PF007_g10038 [Phytophthora fragariae]KAE9115419.1 hypothetical protein PF010_g9334 [Phytophthora fragariae]KAE9145959.1 hypothetical protein PF006_g9239 [Phytophthora fragariae]